jgi:hypothetical protein
LVVDGAGTDVVVGLVVVVVVVVVTVADDEQIAAGFTWSSRVQTRLAT